MIKNKVEWPKMSWTKFPENENMNYQKLDKETIKRFLNENNINPEKPESAKYIEALIGVEKNTKEALQVLKAFLSNEGLIIEEKRTIKPAPNLVNKTKNPDEIKKKISQKLEEIKNKDIQNIDKIEKSEQKSAEKNNSEVAEENKQKTSETQKKQKTKETKEEKKAKLTDKQQAIEKYNWKGDETVQVGEKTYKYSDVKHLLRDGKDGPLTDAFHNKMQELEEAATGNTQSEEANPAIETTTQTNKQATETWGIAYAWDDNFGKLPSEYVGEVGDADERATGISSEKLEAIKSYNWKGDEKVEVDGKTYSYNEVKDALLTGKNTSLIDAFYKKIQDTETTSSSDNGDDEIEMVIIEEEGTY